MDDAFFDQRFLIFCFGHAFFCEIKSFSHVSVLLMCALLFFFPGVPPKEKNNVSPGCQISYHIYIYIYISTRNRIEKQHPSGNKKCQIFRSQTVVSWEISLIFQKLQGLRISKEGNWASGLPPQSTLRLRRRLVEFLGQPTTFTCKCRFLDVFWGQICCNDTCTHKHTYTHNIIYMYINKGKMFGYGFENPVVQQQLDDSWPRILPGQDMSKPRAVGVGGGIYRI